MYAVNMTDRLAVKAIRYEDLPGQLVFPGEGIDIAVHEGDKGMLSILGGLTCDEIRRFTTEEVNHFIEIGGRVVLPMLITGDAGRNIVQGVQLEGIQLEV